MAAIQCEASGCSYTDKSGKIFYQCDKCKRWWCSNHGRQGQRCPACGKGFLSKA